MMALLLALALAGTACGPQAALKAVAVRHPEAVRLVLHAVPRGERRPRVVACNVPAHLGRPSGPEEVRAIRRGSTAVRWREGCFEVVVPLRDGRGRPVAALRVTLRPPRGGRREAVRRALLIARELNEVLLKEGVPWW